MLSNPSFEIVESSSFIVRTHSNDENFSSEENRYHAAARQRNQQNFRDKDDHIEKKNRTYTIFRVTSSAVSEIRSNIRPVRSFRICVHT